MDSFTLHYFDIRGNAEPIRMLAAYAGLPLIDHRFASGEFAKMKEGGKLAFGQVPALELADGTVITQTNAILRFLAKRAPADLQLYPSDDVAAARVDAILDQVGDASLGERVAKYKSRFGIPTSILNDDNADQVFQMWKEETFPRHLGFIENLLINGKQGWVAGTKLPTIADFMWIAGFLGDHRFFVGDLAARHPSIGSWISKFNSLEKLQPYIKKRDEEGQ